MLENLITKTNKFDSSQVDHDFINNTKTYFSIYNNKVQKPFHKFWFTLSNTKFKNEYQDFKVLRFGLNHKSKEVIDFINFIKELTKYLTSIFSKHFSNINIEYPWKEFENYPYLLSIFFNEDTIILDDDKNEIDKDILDYTKTYNILFEIKNIKIVKIVLDNKDCFQLKFTLCMLMIQQEPEIDLKSYLLGSIKLKSNNHNDSNHDDNINEHQNNFKTICNRPVLPFLKDVSNGPKGLNKVDKDNIKTNKLINLDELLSIKSSLKKVVYDDKNISLGKTQVKSHDDSEDEISELGNTFLDQKKKLKKTITEEKTLLNHIKETSKKDKKKKKKEKNIKNESFELENKLQNKLEDDLEKELENLSDHKDKKNKKDKKKNKKDKKKNNSQLEIDELEKELEQFS